MDWLADLWCSADCALQKKMMEEMTRMQQAITRLNTAQTVISARLEAVCNQQASEMRVSLTEDWPDTGVCQSGGWVWLKTDLTLVSAKVEGESDWRLTWHWCLPKWRVSLTEDWPDTGVYQEQGEYTAED